jgi:outer membrane protein assembly factor BamB
MIFGRRCWTALTFAVALAVGLSACGSGGSGPPALSVRCTGRTLAGPDTGAVGLNDVTQPAAPAAVPGVPHPAATPVTGVPAVLDPADPRYGYASRGWNVMRMGATGGPAQWSATIHPAGQNQASSDDAGLSLAPYAGYLIAAGGEQGRDIAAISDQGTVGPVCTLPRFDASDGTVALLPHAGVIIAANPTDPSSGGKDYWLNGYSTATGQRLWAVDTQTSASGRGVDLMVSGDTAYVWLGQTGKIAAYDARTGRRSWVTDSGSVATLDGDNYLLGIAGGRVFATADQQQSSRVEALSSSTGKVLWTRDVPEPAVQNQITLSQIGAGLVAVAGSDRKDYLLDAADGSIVSSLPVEASAGRPQPCSVSGDPAVAVVENGAIGVLSSDPADNRTIPIPPGKSVDVAVASTLAYVRAEKAGAPVRGYDLATGKLRWTLQMPRTQAEDTLYAFDHGFAVLQGATSQAFN